MVLVLNLIDADMSGGGYSELFIIFVAGHAACKVLDRSSFRKNVDLLFWFWHLFLIASISIERAHATFRPCSHRVLTKQVYDAIVAVRWLLAVLLTTSFRLIGNFCQVHWRLLKFGIHSMRFVLLQSVSHTHQLFGKFIAEHIPSSMTDSTEEEN